MYFGIMEHIPEQNLSYTNTSFEFQLGNTW